MRDDGDWTKWLTVKMLTDVLTKMPQDLRLAVNEIGNLLVQSEDGSTYLGYIDFRQEGEYITFKEPRP